VKLTIAEMITALAKIREEVANFMVKMLKNELYIVYCAENCLLWMRVLQC